MIKVNSTVKMNLPRLKELSQASITSLEKTGELLQGDIRDAQVIPMKTGNLKGESFFRDDSESRNGKISLVHSTPYARRLYYHPEFRFNKEFHNNAKGMWFEDWLEGGKNQDFAPKAFKEFYRQEGGV